MLPTRHASAFVLLLLAPLARAEDANPRTVSTTGDAIVYVVPDQAMVSVGVESFNASLDKSKSENDAAAARLLKAVAALGVESKHVQSDVMTTDLRYQDSEHPSKGIEGYFCRRTYVVTLKDIKKLEPLIDAALKNGANQILGFEYRTADLRKHRDAARKQAIHAAKDKAAALASELGHRVGPAHSISESSSSSYGGYFGRLSYSYANNYAQQSQQSAQSDTGGDPDSHDVLPIGQMAVRAQVTVSFDLLD
jgi:uncharacterized protein YggE